MASPTSSNFQFLSAYDTLLVALGAQAESYFTDDPVTCLVKLRQLGELLAKRASAHLAFPKKLSYAQILDRLAEPPHSALAPDLKERLDIPA